MTGLRPSSAPAASADLGRRSSPTRLRPSPRCATRCGTCGPATTGGGRRPSRLSPRASRRRSAAAPRRSLPGCQPRPPRHPWAGEVGAGGRGRPPARGGGSAGGRPVRGPGGASRRRRASAGVQGRGAGGSGLRRLLDPRGRRPRPPGRPGGSRARARRALVCRVGAGAGLSDARAVVGLAPLRAYRQRAHCSAVRADRHRPPLAPRPDSRHVPRLRRPLGATRRDRPVDGHPTPTLSAYDALAHSAGHAAKDRWRWLRSLLDVHVLHRSAATRGSRADRPLRGDQLLSVGLAVRAFGTPPGMPPDRRDRGSDRDRRPLDERVPRSGRRQRRSTDRWPYRESTSSSACAAPPGPDASPREVARLLSRSAFPPWVTAERALAARPRGGPAACSRKRCRRGLRLSANGETRALSGMA